jgi:hypothetical protein
MTEKPEQDQKQEREVAGEEKVLLTWISHPAKARPVVTGLVIIFLTILVALVYSLTASIVFTAIAALILWGSLAQFFLPTRFEFTDRGVKIRYTLSGVAKEWKLFRSYYVDKNGVLLSPFVRPSRLENFRGLYVRFTGNKDDVMAIVATMIEQPSDV